MPMVLSSDSDAATIDATAVDWSICCPFHLAAGTLITAPRLTCVPLVGGRMKKNVSSIHGETIPAAPKPNTMYASSALMACAVLPFGTTKTNDCTGPLNAFTVAGGAAGLQLAGNTM